MAEETTRVDQWLYATLAGDATLQSYISTRVYSELAPAGSTYPCVVFSMASAVDVRGATEATRIMVDGIWTVLAVAETLTWVGVLQDIADRVDALLKNSSGGTADSATILAAHRVRPVRLLEERDGRQFRRLGGQYRVYAQR